MSKRLALLTLLLSVAFSASPALTPDFGGFDPSLFPVAQENPPVQPAGYAFAIWGVIYLWLFASALFGLIARTTAANWVPMRPALCISLAIGAIWLPVALVSAVWASVLIWAMLISALFALFQSPQTDAPWASWPVGLYAGWLSAASCVSLGLLAAGYGWMIQDTAAWVFVGLAIGLAWAIQSQLARSPTYGIAVIWALIAVALRNDFALNSVASLALIGAAALLWPTLKAMRTHHISLR